MSAQELSPCPFCGSPAHGPVRQGGSDERSGYSFRVSIGCTQCGATITRQSHTDRLGWCDDTGQAEREVVEAWNRRSADSAVDRADVPTNPVNVTPAGSAGV